MTPETARYWLGHSTRPPLIPPYIAQEALETIASMDYQEADYRPPGYYTLDELTERGPDLGDNVTRAKRLVGPWEEA